MESENISNRRTKRLYWEIICKGKDKVTAEKKKIKGKSKDKEHRETQGTENVLNCKYWIKGKKIIYKWKR